MPVVAHTRIGFHSGGSPEQLLGLRAEERNCQLEEAYATATVALTRANQLCVILGPIDMQGAFAEEGRGWSVGPGLEWLAASEVDREFLGVKQE